MADIVRRLAFIFYLLLFLAGIVLYVTWAYLFDAWTDIGLYSIVIVLIGLGLFGILLYGAK